MEQAGSIIHSTFAIDVIWSGGYEGARNECKKSEIHRRIEVVHFAVSVLIAKVVTILAQEQEATILPLLATLAIASIMILSPLAYGQSAPSRAHLSFFDWHLSFFG